MSCAYDQKRVNVANMIKKIGFPNSYYRAKGVQDGTYGIILCIGEIQKERDAVYRPLGSSSEESSLDDQYDPKGLAFNKNTYKKIKKGPNHLGTFINLLEDCSKEICRIMTPRRFGQALLCIIFNRPFSQLRNLKTILYPSSDFTSKIFFFGFAQMLLLVSQFSIFLSITRRLN
jgi:hypothetical protein